MVARQLAAQQPWGLVMADQPLKKFKRPGDEETENLYPGAGTRSQPEVQQAIQRYRQLPAEQRAQVPLLYWLLGDGTPPYKMSKEDSEYTEESEVEEQTCANCQYIYQANGHGDQGFICSQIRGEIAPAGWCNRWRKGTGAEDRVDNEDYKAAQAEPEEEPKKKVPIAKIMAALAAAGLAGYGGYKYMQNPYKGDEDVRNLDYWRTRYNLWRADRRLSTRDPDDADVAVSTGLHRVAIPHRGIDEDSLEEHFGFLPSRVAIPERGQTQFKTYRQPGTNLHIHKHPRRFFIHKDRHTPINVTLSDPNLTASERFKGVGEGISHLVGEGVPGAFNLVDRMLNRDPTLSDRLEGVEPHIVPKTGAAQGQIDMAFYSGEEKQAALSVEVAEGQTAEAIGLGGRDTLPADYGMLFKCAKSFWMRGCNFDLDIVFMDKHGSVKEVQHMTQLQPGEEPTVYSPKEAADLALEVPSGWCNRNEIKPGARLQVIKQQGA